MLLELSISSDPSPSFLTAPQKANLLHLEKLTGLSVISVQPHGANGYAYFLEWGNQSISKTIKMIELLQQDEYIRERLIGTPTIVRGPNGPSKGATLQVALTSTHLLRVK